MARNLHVRLQAKEQDLAAALANAGGGNGGGMGSQVGGYSTPPQGMPPGAMGMHGAPGMGSQQHSQPHSQYDNSGSGQFASQQQQQGVRGTRTPFPVCVAVRTSDSMHSSCCPSMPRDERMGGRVD